MPLVRAKVQVEEYGCACQARAFHSEKRCASAWFAAKVRSGKLKGAALLKRSSQHIVNRQLHVSSVIPIKDEWKPIWRFDAKYNGAAASIGLARDKARLNALLLEKVQDEIANGIRSNRSEK